MSHMEPIVRAAIAEGLLDPTATQPGKDERHWAVLVFTALGAWLAAVPILVVIGFFFWGNSKVSGFVYGTPILIASVLALRAQGAGLFVQQLGVPGLIIGAVAFAFSVDAVTDSTVMALSVLMVIAVGVSLMVDQAWLRVLMGAAIGVLAACILMETVAKVDSGWLSRLPWQLVCCGWLALHLVQRSLVLEGRAARRIATVEAVSSGLAAAALAGLMLSSRTFLVSRVFGDEFETWGPDIGDGAIMRALAVTLAIGAGAWLARRWPALRASWYVLLLGVCAPLVWFAPSLGPALAMLVCCVESGRRVLAAFAGVAAVWLVGSLYYDLQWPLAHKALLLAGIGAAIALLGRFAIVAPPAEPSPEPQVAPPRLDRRTRAGFLASALLVLVVANTAIWQKEQVIRKGAPVFVALAPVDPRSLMEGDYMALNFDLPRDVPIGYDALPLHAQVVARVDGRGIAQLLRLHDGRALAQGEFAIDLVKKQNRWVFVTDAWYFKEGEARRWSRARYGEFRVAPDGHALLVGLRGPNLEKL